MLKLTNATIDDTIKPAIEWVNGKPVQKLKPTDFHAFIQAAFLRMLYAWSKIATGGRGKVGAEWRFRIPPNSFNTDSVVPDVAYLATYFHLPKAERRYPAIPPDIVVEVRSPGDDEMEIASKRDFYLSWGVKLVIIADPELRSVEAQEINNAVSHLNESDTLTSKVFPTLGISLCEIFAELDEPE
ncbi:MAG: Uma2 family endonuclease [Candidatus Eremiobacteraeota bacterium]|nr:Uma2 family endonuclease [Candidatus Eremiobacteraeota bacterium]